MVTDGRQTRAPWKIAVGVIALLLAIALGSQLIRSDNQSATADSATAAVPTPAVSAAVTTPPTPQTAATTQPPSVPQPTAPPIPTPTPIPTPARAGTTAPATHLLDSALLLNDTVIVPAYDQVWLNDQAQYGWNTVPVPEGVLGVRCPKVLDDTLTFIAEYDVNSYGFATLDPAAESFVITPLPITTYDLEYGARYCEVANVNGAWVVAATGGSAITFAVSTDQGASFSERHVNLPAELSFDTYPLLATYTTLMPHRDQIIAEICLAYSIEGSCAQLGITFDAAAITESTSDQIAPDNAALTILAPSSDFAGATYGTVGAPTTTGRYRTFFGIGDEVWRAELVEVTGSRDAAYDTFDVGHWAAGPIDGAVVALPYGYKPTWYPYEGGVAAEVPLQLVPFGGDATVETEWWVLPEGATEWTRFPTRLDLEIREINDDVPTTLHSVTEFVGHPALTNLRVVPQRWPADPWHITNGRPEYHGEVLIAGNSIYGVDTFGVWLSGDRGDSWDRIPHPQATRSCAETSESELAFVTRESESSDLGDVHDQYLRILTTADDYRVVHLPSLTTEGSAREALFGCKPLLLGDRWLVGQLNLMSSQLIIAAISPSGSTDEYRFDMTGDWRGDIGPATYVGAIDLYRDGDWIVVRACSPHEGAQCAYTDIVLHASLVTGDSATINVQAEAAAGQIRPVNLGRARAAEDVFQVGAELWRASSGEPTGESRNEGEGGDTVPVYYWLGGPMNDVASPLPGQEVGSHYAPPWRSRNEGLYFLFNGQIMSCNAVATASAECWAFQDDGAWQEHLGPVSVDWATVPSGARVTYSHRSDDGQIMVIPTD